MLGLSEDEVFEVAFKWVQSEKDTMIKMLQESMKKDSFTSAAFVTSITFLLNAIAVAVRSNNQKLEEQLRSMGIKIPD